MTSQFKLSCKQKLALAGVAGVAALTLGKIYFNGAVCKLTRDLSGQVVVITGANTGIGFETAKALAKFKATVILACRDEKRTNAAIEQIKKETGNQDVVFMKLDLSDLASVKEFAQNFKAKYDKLNILINNAGVMALPQRVTSKDGYELQFATNHLGHFYLTNLLLDVIKKSAPSRIINLSSMIQLRGKFNFEDINAEKAYDPLEAYAQSKLANVVFTKELQRRLEGTQIKVVSLHPGAVRTELARYILGPVYMKIVYALGYPFYWYFTKSALQGAQTTLYCALVDHDKLVPGAYYSDCKTKKPNKAALNEENWKRLWEVSENLIKEKVAKLK